MEETGGVEKVGVDAVRNNRESPNTHSQLTFEYDNEKDMENGSGQWRVTETNFASFACKQHFKQISEKDMRALGFHPKWSRPEWLL